MKIRNDFVTNSSSSCFVVYYIDFNFDSKNENEKKVMEFILNYMQKENRSDISNVEDLDSNVFSEELGGESWKINDIDVHIGNGSEYDDSAKIYVNLSEILNSKYFENTPIKEIDGQIVKLINELFGTEYKNKDLYYSEEVIMDN